jgi:cytochrome P450
VTIEMIRIPVPDFEVDGKVDTGHREPGAPPALASLPLAPKNPLSYRRRLAAVKSFHTGTEVLRDAGGPVTRFGLGPKWLTPPIVLATSPEAIRDILSVKDGSVDKKSTVFNELRRIVGENLASLPDEQWRPRRRTLQPVFTKQRVRQFGGHMADAAELVAARWGDDTEIDLDAECRKLTMRALGRSILGLDLGEQTDAIDEPLRIAMNYAIGRALRPVRAPSWLPTPSRRRARAAIGRLHHLADEILQACRANPDLDAPLVQALIAATDPITGESLSDKEIRDELIIFIFSGHDTIATTLTYTLWELGRNPELQERVAAEVAELGDKTLDSDDAMRLHYTVQVLREGLRLCPPAPTGTRLATRDLQVGGYRVEAGTMLAFGRRAVQRDPTLWKDALTFDPDRFSPMQCAGRDRWQYLPFGGGARSCIGDHFAMLEATLALATFIRRVDIRSLHDDFPLTVHFTMVADGPIGARVYHRRDKSQDKRGHCSL